MTAAIDFALVIFGLALLFWAITAADRNAGSRALGASVGLIALIVGLLAALVLRDDHRDWEGRL